MGVLISSVEEDVKKWRPSFTACGNISLCFQNQSEVLKRLSILATILSRNSTLGYKPETTINTSKLAAELHACTTSICKVAAEKSLEPRSLKQPWAT
jgi:hypothetical protein